MNWLQKIAQDSESVLRSLAPQFAQAAQNIYNQWDASDPDYGDAEVGFGGICHLIADEIASVIHDNTDFECATMSSDFEVHVNVVVRTPDGIYLVDIRPYHYETGGGYTWKKIPDVVFDTSHIDIDLLTHNPNEWSNYSEEY